MSIKQKLFSGFGFLILLCVLQGGFALKGATELGQLTKTTYDKYLMTINFSRSAESSFLKADVMLMAALRTPKILKDPETIENFVEASEAVGEDLDVVKERTVSKRSWLQINKVLELNNAWTKTATAELTALSGDNKAHANIAELEKSLDKLSKSLFTELDLLIEYASEDGYVFSQSAQKQVDQAILLTIVAAGTVTVLGLLIAGLLGFSISRPLNKIRDTMVVLAEGDKSVEIPGVDRKDEVGEMARNLGHFKDSLLKAEKAEDEAPRSSA
jgi:methyl-accepting chemotaxis protein